MSQLAVRSELKKTTRLSAVSEGRWPEVGESSSAESTGGPKRLVRVGRVACQMSRKPTPPLRSDEKYRVSPSDVKNGVPSCDLVAISEITVAAPNGEARFRRGLVKMFSSATLPLLVCAKNTVTPPSQSFAPDSHV